MDESTPADPVDRLSGTFADDLVAAEVAEAFKRWIRWIGQGSEEPVPPCFEPLGVDTAEYAWQLGEDVDWELMPGVRSVGNVVHIDLLTHDTWTHLAGLLRRLGATRTQIERG